jgi:16S rRNA processing protein RimM
LSKTGLRDFILLGHVIRPHGLTGLLRIVSYAQSKETFLKAGSVFLGTAKGELEDRRVIAIKAHGSAFLLRLAGIDSIDHAEQLREAEIFIRKDFLIEKDEDEYFWFELLGLEVYLDTGEYLGVLKEIVPTGSNDVYVVEDQGKEYLIPAIHGVVKEIRLKEKRMVISPLKGLLDL